MDKKVKTLAAVAQVDPRHEISKMLLDLSIAIKKGELNPLSCTVVLEGKEFPEVYQFGSREGADHKDAVYNLTCGMDMLMTKYCSNQDDAG